MKVTATSDFSNLNTVAQLSQYVTQFAKQVSSAINGNLTFSDNINVSIVTTTFTLTNTNLPVTHGLSFAPTGYIAIRLGQAGVIYDGNPIGLSSGTINLRFSAFGATGISGVTATLLFF